MRVAIDASSVDHSFSGARARLLGLLGAFQRRKRAHEVVVLAAGPSLAAELGERGVETLAVDLPPAPARRWLRGSGYFEEILARAGADALQAETLPVPRLASHPLLLTLHDLRDLEGRSFAPRTLYARELLAGDLERVRMILAVSADTRRVLESELGVPAAKVEIVPNAPDEAVARVADAAALDAVRDRLALPKRFVLALGHLEPRKNLGVLVAAMRRLRARPEFADVGLVLAGRDQVREGERLLAAARAEPAVPVLRAGVIDMQTRNALLTLGSAVATPSVIEGFGMVPLEAMRAGTPAIVADAHALPEIAGGAALVVAPGDVEAWADAIARVLGDAALREDLVRKGIARAAEFTWERAAAALDAAYSRLAS